MNNVLISLCVSSILFFTSCKISRNDYAYKVNYKYWREIVLKEIDKEVAGAPHECPSLKEVGNSYKDLINIYDFTKNIAYLDTLVRLEKFNPRTDELILVDIMQYNFAFVHASYYLVYEKRKNRVQGFELVRSDPDPRVAVNSNGYRIDITKNKKYLTDLYNKKTNCDLDRIYIITTLDGNYNIKNYHVALLPTQ